MPASSMHLRILLPYRVFADEDQLQELVVESVAGSYGFLPNRLDCVLPLVPGILSYRSAEQQERYVAIDQGILVKTGREIGVSVRRAIGGVDLGRLEHAVEQEFSTIDERESNVRGAMAKLESDFIRRYMELHHG
ncbi:MAG: F0F1 ATP synthase subunit epsilon [Chlorobiaceae bacterium]|nr:F0F1 ATP synthase subunit epsilon [Chlorobiaceae bacterium]